MTDETPLRRRLRRFTAGTTTAGLVLVAVPATLALSPGSPGSGGRPAGPSAPAVETAPPVELVVHRKRHPHRKIKKYRVRRGDTPSSVAVRYHAWTAQLIRMNHSSTLYAGQVIRVPVVVKAARACERHRHHRTGFEDRRHAPKRSATRQAGPKKHAATRHRKPAAKKRPQKPRVMTPGPAHARGHEKGWHHSGASRAQIRRLVAFRAARHGVDPHLALAIAWQESGWQHRRVSSAGALGAMQVMPATGRWMSLVVGRRLNPRDLFDNVTAGVVLIRLLRDEAGLRKAVAGYYQGLAGVRRHGMYPSTKRYVANVLALKKMIARGWNPA